MAKTKKTIQYMCQSCGSIQNKWQGQCPDCNAWDSLVEERHEAVPKGLGAKKGNVLDMHTLKGKSELPPRYKTTIAEFDRVCGSGLVPGSALLIGGDPGIGKSTILLQVVACLSQNNKTAYVSGEEGLDQVRLRAERLDVSNSSTELTTANNVRDIISTMERPANDGKRYDVIVIDSIQTMYMDTIDSAPGTVAQVRACSSELIRAAKKYNICLILVGHVTKQGNLAGPRVMEHMVDTVLYFEGDRGHPYRILRAVKNRFGPTDEIGIFEMLEKGLIEVENPSSFFLSQRDETASGSVVYAGIEGSRPVLVEIQALTSNADYGTPRRAVIGWDNNRLAMIVAVLESRCGLNFAQKDIYLNVAGGLKITEPAADLAVAAALISALHDRPADPGNVYFGEIALSGSVRTVSRTPLRIKEAERLGFKSITCHQSDASLKTKMQISSIKHLRQLLEN